MAEDFLLKIGKEGREQQPQETPTPPQNSEPPKKKSRLHWGCGCAIVVGIMFIVLMAISFFVVGDQEEKDLRKKYLRQDIERLSTNIAENDSISQMIKLCLDFGLDGDDKLNKDGIEYFTRRNGNKVLAIVRLYDLKGFEPSSRKVIVEVIEECLVFQEQEKQQGLDEFYICVEGKWNTLLVKTPNRSDLGGRFADSDLLLPFYNEYVKDSLPSLE